MRTRKRIVETSLSTSASIFLRILLSNTSLPSLTSADIIVVIEEDVWSTPEFLLKLDNAIQNLKGEEWSCLKLFVTDYWSGWENDYKDFITLGFWGVLGAVGGEGSIVGLMWVKGKKWGRLCDWRKVSLH